MVSFGQRVRFAASIVADLIVLFVLTTRRVVIRLRLSFQGDTGVIVRLRIVVQLSFHRFHIVYIDFFTDIHIIIATKIIDGSRDLLGELRVVAPILRLLPWHVPNLIWRLYVKLHLIEIAHNCTVVNTLIIKLAVVI